MFDPNILFCNNHIVLYKIIFTAPVEETLNPSYQHIPEGQNAQFKCSVTENVEWTYKGGPLFPHVKRGKSSYNEHYIQIEHVSKRDEGQYMCTGLYGEKYVKAVGQLDVTRM